MQKYPHEYKLGDLVKITKGPFQGRIVDVIEVYSNYEDTPNKAYGVCLPNGKQGLLFSSELVIAGVKSFNSKDCNEKNN